MSKDEMQYCKTRMKIAGKAINEYKMIGADDRVLLGLSGGVDSMVLLDILSKRRAYLPINYEIHAVHVAIPEIGYSINIDKCENFCKERGVSFTLLETQVDDSIISDSSPCVACARARRNRLFKFATAEKYNKIAFGHHMDDIIETLIMNMSFNGTISTMPPCLPVFQGEKTIIRPLSLLTEKEVKKYGKIMGFKGLSKDCPYTASTKRSVVKDIVAELEKANPKARFNLFRSMQRIRSDYLA